VSAVETRRPATRRPEQGRGGAGPRRSDAERNVAAILEAAASLFRTGADASMTEIAKAAGLGRVTVYGHFESREHLVEALLARATSETERIVVAGELDRGPAPEALARLLRTSWRTLDQHRGLHAVATRSVPPERLRQHHVGVLQHLDRLIERGQEAGDFRSDLPRDWLVSVVYAVMHNAADEVDAGRLAADDAADVLVATLTSALAAPR
jgi:TetR/AcrR family transcriptional regulator, mexCD-oprJ operon repressor